MQPDALDAYRTPDRLKARIAMHERFGNAAFDLHEWLFHEVLPGYQPAKDTRVLEVGAGTGRMWRAVQARVPEGWQLTLTDRSHGMVEALHELNAELDLGATVRTADVMDLPYPNATFDLVFANHMLYHVPEPALGVAELRRVLRPGGLLVAATNGEGHMRQATDLVKPLGAEEGLQLMGVEPLSFTCESGAEQLRASFPEVTLHRHDDALNVTDVDVLLNYLRSLIHLPEDVPAITANRLARWEENVRSTPLPLEVERATGVFVARA